MTNKQVFRNLRDCQVFLTLSDAELEKVASLALEKRYRAGTALFEEGDSAEELLVLQEGKVALQLILPAAPTHAGRRITVDTVTKNEIVGWSAIVEPYTYTLTAVCLQEVKALSINATGIRGLLWDNQVVGYEVLKCLIKVVASRLNDTRQVLISERLLPGLLNSKQNSK